MSFSRAYVEPVIIRRRVDIDFALQKGNFALNASYR